DGFYSVLVRPRLCTTRLGQVPPNMVIFWVQRRRGDRVIKMKRMMERNKTRIMSPGSSRGRGFQN
ncbi:hypothetical protein BDR03DRAFT_964246, partial [Suillus americanus]